MLSACKEPSFKGLLMKRPSMDARLVLLHPGWSRKKHWPIEIPTRAGKVLLEHVCRSRCGCATTGNLFFFCALCSMPMANDSSSAFKHLIKTPLNQCKSKMLTFRTSAVVPRKKAVLDPMISAKSWNNSINLIR